MYMELDCNFLLILYFFQGNYDAFVRTRLELLENQMKQYNWEQDQIAHMKVSSKIIISLEICKNILRTTN